MFVSRVAVIAAALLLAGSGALAQPAPQVEILSPAQPTEGDGKVEVIEFFWYGCPHCFALEPSLKAWLQKAPKDVVFKRVHPSTGAWERHAALYYTLEAMGLLDKLHEKVFEATHKENVNLANAKIRDEWLAKQGVDPAKYAEVEKSFTVATKLQRARQMGMNYKIESVPRLVVGGKYVITGENAITTGVLDQAVATARNDHTAQAPAPRKAATK